jgi:hypothetical protein
MRMVGHIRVGGDDHATFAVGAQVLAGVEAEASQISEAADTPALVLGAVA